MAQAQALQSLGPFFEKFAQMVVQSRCFGSNDVIGTDTHFATTTTDVRDVRRRVLNWDIYKPLSIDISFAPPHEPPHIIEHWLAQLLPAEGMSTSVSASSMSTTAAAIMHQFIVLVRSILSFTRIAPAQAFVRRLHRIQRASDITWSIRDSAALAAFSPDRELEEAPLGNIACPLGTLAISVSYLKHYDFELSPRLFPMQIVSEYEQDAGQTGGTSPPSRHGSPGGLTLSGYNSTGGTPTRRQRSRSEVIPIPRGEPKPQPSDPVGIPMNRTNAPHHGMLPHHSSFSTSTHETIGSSASSLSPPHYLTFESRMTTSGGTSGMSSSSSAALSFRPRAFDSLSQRMSGAGAAPTSSSLGGFFADSRAPEPADIRPSTYRSEPSLSRPLASRSQPEFEFYSIDYDGTRGTTTTTTTMITSSDSSGSAAANTSPSALANRRSLLGSTESMSLLPTVTSLLSFDVLKGEGDNDDDKPFDVSLLDDPDDSLFDTKPTATAEPLSKLGELLRVCERPPHLEIFGDTPLANYEHDWQQLQEFVATLPPQS